MVKEIIYLIGLPCSGKSFYAGAMPSDYRIISNDMITVAYAKQHGISYNEAWHALDRDEVTRICQVQFQEAVKNQQSVIIDNTNLTIRARKLFEADGYIKKALIFPISIENSINYVKKRASKTNKIIPPEVIKQMASSFTMPTAEEGFTEIRFVQK